MEDLSILWTIVIGILAAIVAGWLMKGDGFGISINLITGVTGSILGSRIYGLLGFSVTSIWGTILMSVISAFVMIFIVSLLKKVYT